MLKPTAAAQAASEWEFTLSRQFNFSRTTREGSSVFSGDGKARYFYEEIFLRFDYGVCRRTGGGDAFARTDRARQQSRKHYDFERNTGDGGGEFARVASGL
jgi:hypothetical protein